MYGVSLEKKMMCREQSKASKYYPYRWNLPFLCELERPFPVSKDLAIVVYDPAAYMVCTRTSQHARRGLFGVKVLGVRFSLRVRAIRPQHLLHFVHFDARALYYLEISDTRDDGMINLELHSDVIFNAFFDRDCILLQAVQGLFVRQVENQCLASGKSVRVEFE